MEVERNATFIRMDPIQELCLKAPPSLQPEPSSIDFIGQVMPFSAASRTRSARNLDEAIARLERTIAKLAQQDETARRLMSIPGFRPITASAIQDTSSFAGPRVRRLSRANAQAELFGRQAEAGAHLEDGQSELAQTARCRRPCGVVSP